jgi:hypothetical protein
MSEVISFVTQRERIAGRFSAAAPVGATLYAIKRDGLYFSWCYLNAEIASAVANRIGDLQVDGVNWVRDTDRTLLSPKVAPDEFTLPRQRFFHT